MCVEYKRFLKTAGTNIATFDIASDVGITSNPMRIVADTNVVVAALRSSRGASAALLRLGAAGKVTLVVNVALAFEYEAKCADHAAAVELTVDDAVMFAKTLIDLAEEATNYFSWRPMLRDPGDDMVLETAINGRANAIVSYNHKDFGNVPGMFNISLLKPHDVIKEFPNE